MFSLDSLIPAQVPYPIKGGILRGIRTAIAFIVAGVAASLADGSLVKEFSIIPAAYAPVATLALTTAFTSVDKWLRERGLEADLADIHADVPLTDSTPPPSVVSVPEPVVNVAEAVDTDAVDPTEFDDPKDTV